MVKYGRNFILVLLNHISKKKIEKSHLQKRLNFRVGLNVKMAYFVIPDFCEFLSITPYKTFPIKNVGFVLKNSGNFQLGRHKNFQN